MYNYPYKGPYNLLDRKLQVRLIRLKGKDAEGVPQKHGFESHY